MDQEILIVFFYDVRWQ